MSKANSSNKNLQVIIEFGKLVYFEPDLCNKIFQIKLSHFNGSIEFPAIKNFPNENEKLLIPKNLDCDLFEDSILIKDWGYYYKSKIKSSINYIGVNSLLINFKVKKSNTEECNEIYKILKNWLNLLFEHFEISKKIILRENKTYPHNYLAFNKIAARTRLSTDEIVSIPKNTLGAPIITGVYETKPDTFSYDSFKYIIDLCSTLKDVPTDLSLINDARIELWTDRRKAVLDSSTALELTLTRICANKLLKIKDENLSNSILNRYKTLGNKIQLAHDLDLDLPINKNEYEIKVVKIRNKAIHEGNLPTFEEAKSLFKICEKTIRQFSDLKYFS